MSASRSASLDPGRLSQYLIALVCLLPWLVRHGLRQSPMTNQLRLHLLRVALAVTGIQFWLWALAVPVPIWRGSRS